MATGDFGDPYDLIVIGKGSAAAYYLESIPSRYDQLDDDNPLPLTILVIGEDDNWKGRGYTPGLYGQNVNQASSVVAHRRGSTAPTSNAPQDRLDWAAQNAAILEALADEVVTATVLNISKPKGTTFAARPRFLVKASNRMSYYGCKVVIATGAGIESEEKGHADYHTVPPQVQALSGNPAVMSLDKFMKLGKEAHSAEKRVAILGPAAGTDAVMHAGTLGYPAANVFWLMRNKVNSDGFLNVYPGQSEAERLKIENIIASSKARIVAFDEDEKRGTGLAVAAGSGKKIRCRCSPIAASPVRVGDFEVDYFVYATGQTPTNTLTAPAQSAAEKAKGMLDSSLMGKLEPIYDVNQRLGEAKGSAPWQHVVGVQLEDTNSRAGLMIIGAAAFQVTGKMDHNFLQFEYQRHLDDLMQQSGFEATARATHPDLLSRAPLKSMPRLSVNDCECRESDFLLAWWNHWHTHLEGYKSLDLIGAGWAMEAIDEAMAEGRHLCYLFMQRTQAAQYLYKPDGELRSADFSVQKMLNPTHTMPSALQDCRLLAAINANIGSINASSPGAMAVKSDVDDRKFQVNYLEGKTELRVYISSHYPNISKEEAQAFVEKVAAARKILGNMGFETREIAHFERDLEDLERAAIARARPGTAFRALVK